MNSNTDTAEFIYPDWPAPAVVKALSTTCNGGVSTGVWAGLNLGSHVDDRPAAVQANRRQLVTVAGLPADPVWLNQVHGKAVVDIANTSVTPAADAAFSSAPGQVCAVMTADCLPLLICNTVGTKVAAVHAGWRGIVAGVIVQALQQFGGDDVLVWLGPAIGPQSYEVDDKVRDQFLRLNTPAIDYVDAFQFSRPGHWHFNLYAAARVGLIAAGVNGVFGGDFCTFSDERFYSFRRSGITGRQASLIWLEDPVEESIQSLEDVE